MMNIKRAVKPALALTMAFCCGVASLTACGKKADNNKIAIGSLAPLTGAVATYGIAASNGEKLAVDEINKAGGINGKQVELVTLDEKGDTNEAINAYNKLKKDHHIAALIGDITSGPSIAVAQRAAKENIPMITPTGTAAPITKAGKDIFRVCFLDADQGNMMAEYAFNSMKIKDAAILNNSSSDYSQGLADNFAKKFTALGGRITVRETYSDADVDFKTQLTKIKSTAPLALFVPDYYGKDALILAQAQSVGLNVPMLGGDGWDGIIGQIAKGSKDANGAMFTNHFASDDSAANVQSFVKAYKAKYNETPVSFAALGYDAAKIMCQAIKDAGNVEPNKITAAIQKIKYDGVTGQITFNENGDPQKPIFIIEVKDGQYVMKDKVDIKR